MSFYPDPDLVKDIRDDRIRGKYTSIFKAPNLNKKHEGTKKDLFLKWSYGNK